MTMYEDDDHEEGFEQYDGPSKSQIKRELDALKDLGRELIALPAADLEKLPLEERLLEAVVKAQPLSKGALKRQTGYIGKLIADTDHQAIRTALAEMRQPHLQATQQFHQLESWRDRLLADDDTVMAELREQFTALDSQHLRQLVRNAQKEAKAEQSPKSARLIYKYLQQLAQ